MPDIVSEAARDGAAVLQIYQKHLADERDTPIEHPQNLLEMLLFDLWAAADFMRKDGGDVSLPMAYALVKQQRKPRGGNPDL